MSFKKFTFTALILVMGLIGAFAQTVFLEENFDGGMPDSWTNLEVRGNGTASASWTYTTIGAMGDVPLAAIASTTAENGWMIFDSDLNCSGEQEAWLISPEMTIADLSNIWLTFESYYLSYNDRPLIRIGNDMNNLQNWQSIEVFPGIQYNEFEVGVDDPNLAQNPVNVQMNLSEAFQAIGGTTFFIAFEFLSDETTNNGGSGNPGCAYAWNIDDILLSDEDPRPSVDLVIKPFIAIAKNINTPASQVEPINFLANLGNMGRMDIAASTVKVKVVNVDSGESVYSNTKVYGTIAAGQILENEVIDGSFTPDATPANYLVTYSISPDGLTDANVANNRQTYAFSVGDTSFQKSNAPYVGISVGEEASYSLGNVYHVPNGAGLWARYITFGVTNASDLAGDSITTMLYEWDGDLNGDGKMNMNEVTTGAPVAYNVYKFDGSEDDRALTMPVDTSIYGYALSDDKYYVLVMKYISPDGVQECLLMGDDQTDYTATDVLINDLMDTPEYFTAYASGTDNELTVGSTTLIPLMKLSIGANPILGNDTPVLPESAVSLFPNPVLNTANLLFDLKRSSDVSVEVYDLRGQLLQRAYHDSILNETIAVDASLLSSGVYLVKVKTNIGNRTLKMNVMR